MSVILSQGQSVTHSVGQGRTLGMTRCYRRPCFVRPEPEQARLGNDAQPTHREGPPIGGPSCPTLGISMSKLAIGAVQLIATVILFALVGETVVSLSTKSDNIAWGGAASGAALAAMGFAIALPLLRKTSLARPPAT